MKNKRNYLKSGFGVAILALSLFACGDPALPQMSDDDKAVIEQNLKITEEDVYGNIYLPEEVEGASISWTSNRPDIICTVQQDAMAPGVVTRPTEDTVVTLTATAEKDGLYGKFTREINVKGLERTLTDEDFVGYLFGHFISEGTSNVNGETVATGEQIYFALADEGQGLNFKDTNAGNPVLKSTVGEKGVRDPYLCRSFEGDRYFLIATDLSIGVRGGWRTNAQGYTTASVSGSDSLVLWTSNDLVNWSEPQLLPVAPERAGMTWAPEMIYDEKIGEYVIFWASCIMDEERVMKEKGDAIYCTTTRDFVHFSDTRLFIDNQADGSEKPRNIIDATILKVDDWYYCAAKDGDNNEREGGIRILKTQDLSDIDAWEKVLDLDELGLNSSVSLDNTQLEGPEFFVYNQADRANPIIPEYGLMADQYMRGGGYLPLKTTDLEDVDNSFGSWSVTPKSEYSFDKLTKRHGTILRLTAEEIARVKAAYLPE